MGIDNTNTLSVTVVLGSFNQARHLEEVIVRALEGEQQAGTIDVRSYDTMKAETQRKDTVLSNIMDTSFTSAGHPSGAKVQEEFEQCVLPDKPSELIQLALNDVEKVEAQPEYVINMNVWISLRSIPTLVCAVCFGGAVMTQTCHLQEHPPLDDPLWPKFVALNHFRQGHIASGLASLGLLMPRGCPDRVVVRDYAIHSTDFENDVARVIRILKSYGL